MRLSLLGAVAAVVLIACSPQTPPPSAPSASPGPPSAASPSPSLSPLETSFKLMNFNIEYGGTVVDFAKIIEAARLADPDVIALEEAEGNTQRVADELGWPHANARHQLVSKFPIIDPPGADGRYAYVELAEGAVVAISNVHLPSDPYGPYAIRDGATSDEVIALENATRIPALDERLDALPGLVDAGLPTFLLGDFNAPSHLDWTEAAVGTRPQIKFPVAWPVSTAIEAAGFRDSYREVHPDPVSHPGLTWWAGRPVVDDYPDHADPQDRIDIIYAAGEATPTDVVIIGEAGGPQVDIGVEPWGTDHRAVMATFDVTPGNAAPYVAVDERLITVGDELTVRYHGPGDELQLAAADVDEPFQSAPLDSLGRTWAVDTSPLQPGDYEVRLTAGGELYEPRLSAVHGHAMTVRRRRTRDGPGRRLTRLYASPTRSIGSPSLPS